MSNFQPKPGVTVYTADNRPLILDHEVGRGGEGSVWSIGGAAQVVAKFYHKGLTPVQARKLESMCRLQSESLLRIAAWPTAMLKESAYGQPQGLLMPRVKGYQEAHLLYTPKSRRASFPEAQFPFILHACANIARAFATVHDAGQVIGDVNHGNLLISNEAMVALIDCDSFEISDGQSWFPCPVGVPTYTPPELQGRSFQGIRRTPQHDAFGLAVLLFHLLFLGRHPFAGIFRQGSADKTIEDAIREFRFAYLPLNHLTEMEPPPSIPILSEFPSDIGQLFVRAFSREGANGLRPAAREWIAPLESLARSLKRCTSNDSHHYFQALTACPWCRFENTFGRPAFGIKFAVVSGSEFDLAGVWAQIEAIRPDEQNPAPQFTNAYTSQCRPDPRIPEIKKKRWVRRILSAGSILFAVVLVIPGLIPAFPSICILGVGIALMAKLWRYAESCADELKSEHQNARKSFDTAMEQWTKVQKAPAAFHETKQRLLVQKLELGDLATIRARRIAELKAELKQKQLLRFLERHRLEDATIPNIGAGRKTLLRCYGIDDASDVHPGIYIKGFGPALKSALLSWRRSIEQQFVFNPHEDIDPTDIKALDHELTQRKAVLVQSLSTGPLALRQIALPWQVGRAKAVEAVNHSAKTLAQTEVNMKALGRF